MSRRDHRHLPAMSFTPRPIATGLSMNIYLQALPPPPLFRCRFRFHLPPSFCAFRMPAISVFHANERRSALSADIFQVFAAAFTVYARFCFAIAADARAPPICRCRFFAAATACRARCAFAMFFSVLRDAYMPLFAAAR